VRCFVADQHYRTNPDTALSVPKRPLSPSTPEWSAVRKLAGKRGSDETLAADPCLP
jgi:hypothetical protein